jgi:UPF0755 protein
MKRLAIGLAVLAAGGVLLAALTAVYVGRYLDTPLGIGDDAEPLQVALGTSFRGVSDELAGRGILERPGLLRAYARWTGQAGGIHAGDYLLEPGLTARQLLEKLTSGSVRLYAFTIVEGWNHWELLRALQSQPEIEAAMTGEDWPSLLAELDAATDHPEGLFLPETYHFPRGTTDRELLKQAYRLMQATLDERWAVRSPDTPVRTPYEALILASIVEKETARADERARIAGVFRRRLEKGMRLQTDPTVIYGIGPAFDGNLRRRDLQTDTPYNTYTRGGLPPTPIAMPGRDAIDAALNPADGEELYFVATGLGDGSHAFSKTKAEHDAAVAEYLRRLRQRRARGD